MSGATLIKVDRNGSKHYEGFVVCDRCSGRGLFAVGTCNGELMITRVDDGICHKCFGTGKVISKWIERTPEYQAKLDAKRIAKQAAQQAELAEQQAKLEAERQEREEAERKEREERERLEAERKAVSQHVGNVGDKINMTVTYERSASWEQPSYGGYGMETCYAHIFKDENGNVLTWKTSSALGWWDNEGRWNHPEDGDKVILTGRIKGHTTYREEKQTVLTRCKVKLA
jgi:hypothetical protein